MTRTRVLLWIAAVVAATGVATTAVAMATASDGVLSPRDVARQLAGATTAPPTPGAPTSGAEPTPAISGLWPSDDVRATALTKLAEAHRLISRAGFLVVRCGGGTVVLDRWTTNPGYRVDEVRRGPAPSVSVWFESDRFDDLEAVVTCDGTRAVLTDHVEVDDHGGDKGGGKSGRG